MPSLVQQGMVKVGKTWFEVDSLLRHDGRRCLGYQHSPSMSSAWLYACFAWLVLATLLRALSVTTSSNVYTNTTALRIARACLPLATSIPCQSATSLWSLKS